MFTNKPEFRVKEVIQLSKLSSEVLNDLLTEANVYLTKRILTYVLAQQISIQIASDRDLVQLRGYASELEDYTLLQLLNFTDAQGIEIDTFDIKFRLWTVIFNNLRELSIRDSWIQKYLENNEPYFEYTQDLFSNLNRFIDEPNDIDGQPFIIAKESLMRFSSKEEVEMLAESIGVNIPAVLDKEATVNFILRDLEDTNPDLKNELMKKSIQEIEAFAKDNYVNTEFKFTKKELVNYILDNYDQLDEHIRNIEYQKHLEIPSLYKYQSDEAAKDAFKPNKVFDQELKEMIATIITGENDDQETITEEKSKEELEKVMNDIAQTYTPPKREDDDVLLKRIDELEKRLQEKNNYDPNMIALMNKISNLENQMHPSNYSREDMLLRKLDDLEGKISGIAKGEAPVSEAKLVEQSLLAKISELEERLSFQAGEQYVQKMTPQPTPTVTEQVQVQVQQQEPEYEIDADDDYEYDVDHFIPKAPVIKDLSVEAMDESVEDEPVEDTFQAEPITETVEEPKESETEKALMAKLAEIEAKLEERDTEIESLKEEVELSKTLAAEKESEEIQNAKLAQEEAERKLEEQSKELNLLRFLSTDTQPEETEEMDELLELEKLDTYTDDEEVDSLYPSEEEPEMEELDEITDETVEELDDIEDAEEVEEEVVVEEGTEETISTSDDDSVNDILEKIGVAAPKKKEDSEELEEDDFTGEIEFSEQDESLEDIVEDIENMELEDEVDDIEYEVEGFETEEEDEDEGPMSEFDEFITEIHSRRDSEKVKLRRRHTIKPITIFWKSLAIWAGLVIIAGVILVVYNNL